MTSLHGMETSQDTFPHGAAHLYILLMDCLERDSFNWTKCFNRHFTECQPVIAVLCIAEEDSPANITVCSITGKKLVSLYIFNHCSIVTIIKEPASLNHEAALIRVNER